jgi:hypothetical protein
MPRLNTAISHGTSFASLWKQFYERAIVELDSNQLPGRIADARHAIFDRAEEILTKTVRWRKSPTARCTPRLATA